MLLDQRSLFENHCPMDVLTSWSTRHSLRTGQHLAPVCLSLSPPGPWRVPSPTIPEAGRILPASALLFLTFSERTDLCEEGSATPHLGSGKGLGDPQCSGSRGPQGAWALVSGAHGAGVRGKSLVTGRAVIVPLTPRWSPKSVPFRT